jgi:hypothetical protein
MVSGCIQSETKALFYVWVASNNKTRSHVTYKLKVPLHSIKYMHVFRIDIFICRYVNVGDYYGAVSYTSRYQVFFTPTPSCKNNKFDVI